MSITSALKPAAEITANTTARQAATPDAPGTGSGAGTGAAAQAAAAPDGAASSGTVTAAERQQAADTLAQWHAGQPPPSAATVQNASLFALAQRDTAAGQDYIKHLDAAFSGTIKSFVDTHDPSTVNSASTAADAFLASPHATGAGAGAGAGAPPTIDTGTARGKAASALLQAGGAAADGHTVQQANLWALTQANSSDPAARAQASAFVSALPAAQGQQTQAFLDNHRTNSPDDPAVGADAFCANPGQPNFRDAANGTGSVGGTAALAAALYSSQADNLTDADKPNSTTMQAATLWGLQQASVSPENYQKFLQSVGDPKDRAMISSFVDGHRGKAVDDPDTVAAADQLWHGAPVDEGPGTHYRPDNLGRAGSASYDAADPQMAPKDIAATLVPLILTGTPIGVLAGGAARGISMAAAAASRALGVAGPAGQALQRTASQAAELENGATQAGNHIKEAGLRTNDVGQTINTMAKQQ